MQIAGDPGALGGQSALLLQFQQPALPLQAIGLHRCRQPNRANSAEKVKRPRFPKMRRKGKGEDFGCYSPDAMGIGRVHLELVIAWTQIRVKCDPTIAGLNPVAIIALKLILETYLIGGDEAIPRVMDFQDAPAAWAQAKQGFGVRGSGFGIRI